MLGLRAAHAGHHDLLAAELGRHAVDRGLEQLGVVGEHALDLPRGDVLAAAADRVRPARDEPEEAVLVAVGVVAGVEPEVAHRAERRGVVAPVALHHHERPLRAGRRSRPCTPAGTSTSSSSTTRASYHGVGRPAAPGRRLSQVHGDRRPGLGHPVRVEHGEVEALLELLDELGRGGRADDHPHACSPRSASLSGCLSRMRSISPWPLNAVTPSRRQMLPEAAGGEARLITARAPETIAASTRHVLGVRVEEREDREQHVVLGVADELDRRPGPGSGCGCAGARRPWAGRSCRR